MERTTKQRSAVRAAFDRAGRPLSPNEVLDEARAQVPAMGIATVYRAIKLLLEEGAIRAVTLPGENPRYETVRPEHDHHHHFHCRVCDRVFDIHACPGHVERLAPDGYVVEHHELTLYGVCSECAASGVRARF